MSEQGSPRGFSMIGVVEGFYGRVWSPSERAGFIDALHPFGLNTYLYAPKHEAALGTALLEPLDDASRERIGALQRHCESRGIGLLAGLHLEPPFDPAQEAHREALVAKAQALAALGVAGFAVLFDDVPSARREGNTAGAADAFGGSLARAQGHAFNALQGALASVNSELQWLVCPGRYTLDPLLEEVYGRFEEGYLGTLHGAIPTEVPWLWTGPRVCSPTVTLNDRAAYLAQVNLPPVNLPPVNLPTLGAQAVPRPLVLWDNYPVNDMKMASRLHLDPLGGRAADLQTGLEGYLLNPMLQPALGALPAATCLLYANDPAGYTPTAAWQRALDALLPQPLHEAMAEFVALTRSEHPTGGLPAAWPRGSFPLAERLMRAWPGLSMGEPVEPFLANDLVRVVTTLERGLPAAMGQEAAPWLARLRQALGMLEAVRDGAPPESLGPLRAQFHSRYRGSNDPDVLGPWFP